MAISLRLISREKITEVMPCLMEAERATSSASVDLPMAGRAAITIICPPWKPCVSSSSSWNPVGTPCMPERLPAASISSTVASMTSFSGT